MLGGNELLHSANGNLTSVLPVPLALAPPPALAVPLAVRLAALALATARPESASVRVLNILQMRRKTKKEVLPPVVTV